MVSPKIEINCKKRKPRGQIALLLWQKLIPNNTGASLTKKPALAGLSLFYRKLFISPLQQFPHQQGYVDSVRR